MKQRRSRSGRLAASALAFLLLLSCSPLRLSLSVYNAESEPIRVRIGKEPARTVEPGEALTNLDPLSGTVVSLEGPKGRIGSWKIGESDLPAEPDTPPALLIAGDRTNLAAAVLLADTSGGHQALVTHQIVDLSQSKGPVLLPGRYLVVAPKAKWPPSFAGMQGFFKLVKLPSSSQAVPLEQRVREQVEAELKDRGA